MEIRVLSSNTPTESSVLEYIGRIANVCYMKGDIDEVFSQDEESAVKRAIGCLDNGHHSVFDHVTITLSVTGLDKISACVLNSIGLYATSERSGRYCEFKGLSEKDETLYRKCKNKIEALLSDKDVTNREKTTICNENARYFISSFATNCEMIYTINIRTMGYLVQKIRQLDHSNLKYFEHSLVILREFASKLENIMQNAVKRPIVSNKPEEITFFRDSLSSSMKEVHSDAEYLVGDTYHSIYNCSIAALGQKVRSRKLELSISLENEEYYCPQIVIDADLKKEWEEDMRSISDLLPQGRIVRVSEIGRVSDFFIYQVAERICSHAMYETFKLVEKQAYSLRHSIIGKDFFIKDEESVRLKKKCEICKGCSTPCNKNLFERRW